MPGSKLDPAVALDIIEREHHTMQLACASIARTLRFGGHDPLTDSERDWIYCAFTAYELSRYSPDELAGLVLAHRDGDLG